VLVSVARTSKGNPAHKRMGNDSLKARRAASWRAGKLRKQARVDAQREREKANRERRAAGLPTPWEERVGLEAAERMRTARARRRERLARIEAMTR
jgi:hypothetical protein